MYLLYLDDSGSPANASENYFVLGGVCVFERQAHWMAKGLQDLATSIDPGNPDGFEFHASEIFSGRTAPWSGMVKDQRRGVIRKVLDVAANSNASTKLFACAVHKASFPGRDPVELAFEELCGRFDLLLKRLYAEGTPERGVIILDKSSHETSLQKLASNFRTLGTRWGVVVNLVEVPLFVDSRSSRLVQLADHVAYAVFRRYESGDASYFDSIASRFDQADGRVHGLVHRQTISPQCMCPACLSRLSHR